MRDLTHRVLNGGRDGLAVGLVLGIVHVVILATAGLFTTSTPLDVLLSVARYAGLLGLLSGAAGILTAIVTSVLPGMRSPRRGGAFGIAFLFVYGLAWMVFVLKEMIQPRTSLMLVGGVITLVALIVLYAVLVSLRAHRESDPTGAAPSARPTRAFAGLLAIAILLYMSPFVALRPSPEPPADEVSTPAADRLNERAASSFAGRRWNVLLLTVDTLRADRLGCYGYDRETSPAIDSLAAEGMLFEHAICQRPTTSPSFATILTGTYPARHGIHRPAEVLLPSNVTLAEILGESGWTTAAMITNGNLYPDFGFDQGFETYVYGHQNAEAGTDEALDWLDRHAATSEPWFLWVHHTDPHMPYQPPEPYAAMFADPSGDTDTHRRQRNLYDAEIRYTDDQIGRTLRWVTDHGMRDRTLIIFTADHGESLGEHAYFYGHGLHPYDPSARIPLIVSAPQVVPTGAVSSALIGGVDILPTLLDALGIPSPPDVQGISALPAVVGLTDDGPRDFVFLEAGFGPHNKVGFTRALRRHGSKYVQRLTDWARWPRDPISVMWTMDARVEECLRADELYDLRSDPGETVNLLQDRPDLARREREALAAFASRLLRDTMTAASTDPTSISDEALESLRNLGYID